MNGRSSQHRRPQGTNPPPRPEPETQAAPTFDPGHPVPELVDEDARRAAEALQRVNKAQIRQFFQEVKDLHRQLRPYAPDQKARIYQDRFEPRFKMLKSRAAYSAGRNRDNEPLRQFIWKAVDGVRSAEDFEKFVMHFEAVLGFYYYRS